MNRPAGRPDIGLLADWIEGRLEPGEAAEVEQLVADGGDTTRHHLDWLRRFLDVAGSFSLDRPPPIVRQRLRQEFDRRTRGVPATPPPTVRAELQFDSRDRGTLAGMRAGVDSAETFHLAYAGDHADVVLDVTPADAGSVALDGQVLLHAESDAPVFTATASTPDGSLHVIDGDELGRFTFPALPVDSAALTVENGELVIALDLELGVR